MKYRLVNTVDPHKSRQRLESFDMLDALKEALNILGYDVREGENLNSYELVDLNDIDSIPKEINIIDCGDAMVEALDMIGYIIQED